jgi:hypothetical protein
LRVFAACSSLAVMDSSLRGCMAILLVERIALFPAPVEPGVLRYRS